MRLAKERTTLIIAHRMGTLKDVSRRLYFEKGSIAGAGIHEDLLHLVSGYQSLVKLEVNLK